MNTRIGAPSRAALRTTPGSARTATPPGMPDLLRRRPAMITAGLLGLTVLAFAWLAWDRRWMSDDGLIFLRTVRQIVAGNGPVFNAGERVEANTSTLWTLVLLALSLLPVRLELASVGCGLVLAAGALALALDAARRYAALGRVAVPAGAMVVLAVPPFWEFATSGLETALSWLWLAAVWWLLVRRSQRAPRLFAAAAARRRPGRAWPLAVIIGLGPLVRPDLAVAGVVAGAALVVLEQPRTPRAWWRMAGLTTLAAAAPAAYEVFRAGYYGVLVPASALAKEASVPRWGRGFTYLRDTLDTYALIVPALALVVAAVALAGPVARRLGLGRPALGRLGPDRPGERAVRARSEHPPSLRSPGPESTDPGARRTRTWDRAGTVAVGVAPVLAGVVMVLYVVRVGGDFMHARMLLPAIFCLLLPVMAVPLRRATVVPVAVVAVWALMSATSLRPGYDAISGSGIADERGFYARLLGTDHPLTADDYRHHPDMLAGVRLLDRSPGSTLAMKVRGRGPAGPEWTAIPLRPGAPARVMWLNLGVAGTLAPLDVQVSDTVGLATPLAAHTTDIPIGRVGHDKNLPPAWFVAMGGGVADDRVADPGDVAAAERALRCPALVDLDASVHAPLTPTRFWANLVGAPARTELRYPRDPVLADLTCP